jgi:hypothetical protein
MFPSRWHLAFVLLPILAISWLLIALIDPDGPQRSIEYITIGHLFGAMFGLTSVAAAWAAFGPGRWYARVPLGLLWITLLVGAMAINMSLYSAGPDKIALLLFVCLLGQWLLVQLPLWILTLIYGLRMVHRSDLLEGQEDDTLSLPQFGIRQLMILTAIVAVVLGLMRALILVAADTLPQGDAAAFIFLAVAAIVMTLPLVVAATLPRWWHVATVVVLALIALVTYSEFGLGQVAGLGGNGPDHWHYVWINTFTALWVLLPVSITRLTGYRLTNQPIAEQLAKRSIADLNPFAPPASASRPQSPASAPPSPSATAD